MKVHPTQCKNEESLNLPNTSPTTYRTDTQKIAPQHRHWHTIQNGTVNNGEDWVCVFRFGLSLLIKTGSAYACYHVDFHWSSVIKMTIAPAM